MSKLGPLHIIKQTSNNHTASVVFLHGSGDTGEGVLSWIKLLVKDFSLPHVKFLFPTAPLSPYTPLQGQLSNVWFDRFDITPEVPEHTESLETIEHAINSLINKEVESGIPLNRIIVGGFSMGGSLALHTAYRFTSGLAGTFVLSSFLNNGSAVYRSTKLSDTPLYMCHGDRDTLVPTSWGRETYNELTALGAKGEFVLIKNTLHELKKHELLGLLQWIQKIVPPEAAS